MPIPDLRAIINQNPAAAEAYAQLQAGSPAVRQSMAETALLGQQAQKLRHEQEVKRAMPAIISRVKGKSPEEAFAIMAPIVGVDTAVKWAQQLRIAEQERFTRSMLTPQQGASQQGQGNGLSALSGEKLVIMAGVEGSMGKMAQAELQRRQANRQFEFQTQKFDIDQEKKASDVSIPGYDFAEGITPVAADAKEVKDAQAASSKLVRLGKTLKGLVKKHGFQPTTQVPFGGGKTVGTPASKRMESVVKAMQMQQKNLDDLGALQGPDMQFLNQFPDPTSRIDARSMGGVDEFQSQLDDFLQRAQENVTDIAKARGYVPKGNSPLAPTPQLAQPESRRPTEWLQQVIQSDSIDAKIQAALDLGASNEEVNRAISEGKIDNYLMYLEREAYE